MYVYISQVADTQLDMFIRKIKHQYRQYPIRPSVSPINDEVKLQYNHSVENESLEYGDGFEVQVLGRLCSTSMHV